MTFTDVRNVILLVCQECSGLVAFLLTVIKCVNVPRSYPRVQYVRGRGWVGDTRFDDVVSF